MRSIEKNYRYEGMPYVDLYRDTEAAADWVQTSSFNTRMCIIMELQPSHLQDGMKECTSVAILGLIIQTPCKEGMELKCLCCKECHIAAAYAPEECIISWIWRQSTGFGEQNVNGRRVSKPSETPTWPNRCLMHTSRKGKKSVR
jgi:hypothetical protein